MNAPDRPSGTITRDAFAGGRIILDQPARGLRAGSDALFLAAAVPVAAGERVIEAGIGTGAAALALLARVSGTRVVGIERDREHAALARSNAIQNRLADRVNVVECDIGEATVERLRELGIAPGFDHAMANPPFFDEGSAQAPASPSRRAAHVARAGALGMWVARLSDVLRGGGTLTMIHRAAALDEMMAAFSRCLGGIVVLPLAAREGADASRILVQARKGARAAPRLMAPFILHRPDNSYGDDADTVLRLGAALDLGSAPVRIVCQSDQDQ